MKQFLKILCFCMLFSQSLLGQNTDIMLQGFNWDSHANANGWYSIIDQNVGELANADFDMIWLNPPSNSAASQGYLPRELYDLNSPYGTEAELRALIAKLHNNDIKVLADIVINHRVGSFNWADFDNPAWGCWAVTSNDEWGTNGGNPCGNYDTGDNYHAARDLDHSNTGLQNGIIEWMNWLRNDIGFDGWRYDYVRGYSGYYNKLYNEATNPYFSVGELWDNLDINNSDPHRQQTINWIDATASTSTAFDFTTKGVLQQAVQGELWRLSNNGQAPGVIGWWPGKAVTFIDNHDTGSSQAYWPFPSDKIMQGYAYILSHPGTPCVFWDHYFDWGLGDEIKAIMEIRKNNGIHSESVLNIQAAEANLYAAVIDDKVAMKIGSGNWSPSGNDWTLSTYGNDYAIWTKSIPEPPAEQPYMTIHWKTNVSNPTIYFWDVENPGANALPTWPGEAMQAEGNGWFSFTIEGSCASLIFNDNGSNQSENLATCDNSWYDNAWLSEPQDETPPELIVSPAGGNFPTGNVSVSILANDSEDPNPVIYYTTDGSDPNLNSSSAVGATNLDFNSATSLKVFTQDNLGNASAIQLHNYTFNPPTNNSFTVYFKKPNYWTQAMIYHWNALPLGALNDALWPGQNMVDEGNNWYSYTFNNIESTSIIFNGNNGQQSPDLFCTTDAWYKDGVWYNENPEGALSDMTVYFKPNTYSNPRVYFWNTIPSEINTTWPGENMLDEGNGWYSYTFAETDCTNLIFSNSGTGQSADLYRCGDGWFENGSWLNNARQTQSSEKQTTFKLAPNPAVNFTQFTFELENTGLIRLEIYDLNGQLIDTVINENLNKGQYVYQYNLSGLSQGMYSCKLTVDETVQNWQLQVMR